MNEELKSITNILLDEKSGFSEIRNACEALYDFFIHLTSFEAPINNAFIQTENGRALPPYMAALCIKDMMRTRQFLRGIYKAIEDKLGQKSGPVKILYAGSGPFATLLTPLKTCFTSQQIQFQLLEINPASVDLLNKMIQDLGMSDYIFNVLTTDATSFTIDKNFQPDIIVSETMNAGLMCEPQVAIMAHLVSQAGLNTLIIPEKIKVDLCLMSAGVEKATDLKPLGSLMEFDANSARAISEDMAAIPVLHEGINISIPPSDPNYSSLVLRTLITVYKDVCIGFNESGLTVPLQQMVRDPKTGSFPQTLNYKYVMGKRPEFIYKILSEKRLPESSL